MSLENQREMVKMARRGIMEGDKGVRFYSHEVVKIEVSACVR